MPGLMNGTPMPEGRDEGGAAPPPAAGKNGDQQPASPEEQRAYDKFVANGMQMMYSPKVMPKLLQLIATDSDPVRGLARALAMVVLRLDDGARQSGVELSLDVKGHGGVELAQRLAELAGPEGAGVHEYTPEEMTKAVRLSAAIYQATRQEQGGGQGAPAGAQPGAAGPPAGQPPPQAGAMPQGMPPRRGLMN